MHTVCQLQPFLVYSSISKQLSEHAVVEQIPYSSCIPQSNHPELMFKISTDLAISTIMWFHGFSAMMLMHDTDIDDLVAMILMLHDVHATVTLLL